MKANAWYVTSPRNYQDSIYLTVCSYFSCTLNTMKFDPLVASTLTENDHAFNWIQHMYIQPEVRQMVGEDPSIQVVDDADSQQAKHRHAERWQSDTHRSHCHWKRLYGSSTKTIWIYTNEWNKEGTDVLWVYQESASWRGLSQTPRRPEKLLLHSCCVALWQISPDTLIERKKGQKR